MACACRWYNDHTLLDPYAPLVSGRRKFGVRDEVEKFEEQVSTQPVRPGAAADSTARHAISHPVVSCDDLDSYPAILVFPFPLMW